MNSLNRPQCYFSWISAGCLFKHHRQKDLKVFFDLECKVWPVDESGGQEFSSFE